MGVLSSKKFRVMVKSLFHIGCGEVYDPLSFIVDEANKELLILNMDAFIKALTKGSQARIFEHMSQKKLEISFRYV